MTENTSDVTTSDVTGSDASTDTSPPAATTLRPRPPSTNSPRSSVPTSRASSPVVFVHGLWLLDSSWDRWATFFEETRLRRGHPRLARRSDLGRIGPSSTRRPSPARASATWRRINRRSSRSSTRKPALIGHSFGGVLVQILAGRGLSAATVAIDPAPSRGVLPLPFPALKAASPVLSNPANRHKAMTLTFEQFRYGFANVVAEEEAHELYEKFHVAGSGVPVFQAAFANINPRTEVKAKRKGEDRGPMLVISGEFDHQAPPAIAKATYKKQRKNEVLASPSSPRSRSWALADDRQWLAARSPRRHSISSSVSSDGGSAPVRRSAARMSGCSPATSASRSTTSTS